MKFPADLTEYRNQLDNLAVLAASAAGVFNSARENLIECFQVADTIGKLREAITPEMMGRILKLQNQRLGFRTDRDPKKVNKKTGKAHEPYPMEVVKDCLIESILRGLKPVGNQWNIISGELYITQEGYLFKLRDWLDHFSPVAGVPRRHAEGAIVPYSATFRRKGSKDLERYEAEIPVRITGDSTAQQILGKAARQFYRRIYDMVSSMAEPDDDASPVAIPEHVPGKQG